MTGNPGDWLVLDEAGECVGHRPTALACRRFVADAFGLPYPDLVTDGPDPHQGFAVWVHTYDRTFRCLPKNHPEVEPR